VHYCVHYITIFSWLIWWCHMINTTGLGIKSFALVLSKYFWSWSWHESLGYVTSNNILKPHRVLYFSYLLQIVGSAVAYKRAATISYVILVKGRWPRLDWLPTDGRYYLLCALVCLLSVVYCFVVKLEAILKFYLWLGWYYVIQWDALAAHPVVCLSTANVCCCTSCSLCSAVSACGEML